MRTETRTFKKSKFCINCGALVEIEATDDTKRPCKDCRPYYNTVDDLDLKIKHLYDRRNWASAKLATLREERGEALRQATLLN